MAWTIIAWTIIKILIVVVIVAVLALVLGPCVYYNFIAGDESGMPNMPKVDKASHSVYIENTGNLILTDDYEVHGTEVGKRIYVLHGFWEFSGSKFKYKDGDIILDEQIFGEITVKRREK